MKKLNSLAAVLLMALLSACNSDTKEYVHVGPNWAALNNIQPSEQTFNVKIKAESAAFLGDKLTLKVKSEQAGRLWIVQVAPNDEVSLIYPNAMSTQNQIAAENWKSIPAEGSDWSIEAMKPVGVSVLVFIVTKPGTDLNTVFNGQAESMNKALHLVKNAGAWGLAKQIIDIKEK